jgi:hypothetical protein
MRRGRNEAASRSNSRRRVLMKEEQIESFFGYQFLGE